MSALSKPQIAILRYLSGSAADVWHFYRDLAAVGTPAALLKLDRAKLIDGVFTGWSQLFPSYQINDAGRAALSTAIADKGE